MRAKFNEFMEEALNEAQNAQHEGEVPVGAVIVRNGEIIARGQNQTRRLNDPTAHAEIVALRAASQNLQNFRLDACDLYVTLEPCAMCAGAIEHARIRRLYYGASDAKSGGVEHGARVFTQPQCHHNPEIYSGIGENEAQKLLQAFFATRRK